MCQLERKLVTPEITERCRVTIQARLPMTEETLKEALSTAQACPIEGHGAHSSTGRYILVIRMHHQSCPSTLSIQITQLTSSTLIPGSLRVL